VKRLSMPVKMRSLRVKREHAVHVTQFVDFVGKASVLFDTLQNARTDQEREEQEPLAAPPGDPSDPSSGQEPSLELEGDNVAGTSPGEPLETDGNGDPSGEFLRVTPDQTESPSGELPHPPVVAQPIAVGLDHDQQESNRAD
jgi:hypothetical protein